MAEHFDTYRLSAGSADVLLTDVAVDFGHLFQVELASQHHNVGKLGVEAQGFHITYIKLCGQMHLLAYPPCIVHHRHVRCNHGGDAGSLGGIHDGVHQGDVVVIYNGIHREVAFHAVLVAGAGYLAQVVDGKGVRRACTHIQVLDAEIDGIGSGLDGCRQGLAGADGSHDFELINRRFQHIFLN